VTKAQPTSPNGTKSAPNASLEKDTARDLFQAAVPSAHFETLPLGSFQTDTAPDGISQPRLTDDDEGQLEKARDVWRFGATTIPPELITQYLKEMQKLRASEVPGARPIELRGDQATQEQVNAAPPLASDQEARNATTQASRSRLTHANDWRIVFAAAGALCAIAFFVWLVVRGSEEPSAGEPAPESAASSNAEVAKPEGAAAPQARLPTSSPIAPVSSAPATPASTKDSAAPSLGEPERKPRGSETRKRATEAPVPASSQRRVSGTASAYPDPDDIDLVLKPRR
jgi:hypothetical protein